MLPAPGSDFGPDTTPVYVISVAAQLFGLHPQTLRQYDRLGLVSPRRSRVRGRRYSVLDIRALREVQRLTADGVNLAGVKRILELENAVASLRAQLAELAEIDAPEPAAGVDVAGGVAGEPRERVPVHANLPVPLAARRGTSVVLWRRRAR